MGIFEQTRLLILGLSRLNQRLQQPAKMTIQYLRLLSAREVLERPVIFLILISEYGNTVRKSTQSWHLLDITRL